MAYNRDWAKGRITGATVGHGQKVGEGMTIPRGMESIGNITTACVVFLVTIFFLSPHPLTRAMTQVMHTRSRATRRTINSFRAGHKTAHKMMTTGTRMAFKPKSVWSLPSKPSPHVIFLGLGPDFSEADVCRRTLYIFAYRAGSVLYSSCRHTCPIMDATLKRSPS
ncbi:hypothetical protein M405DRAFT_601251 [Rhizopogon salebrosus TDB-379]|nr:hypothetical protein M405DRAFT_601251 [Rhizopogon salebrosus TDB-379]